MRIHALVSSAIMLGLAACGQPPAPGDAAPSAGAASGQLSAADQTAILAALSLTADGQGLVENECGEKVTPSFLPADVGGSVGVATLFAIAGGPNMAACYGDGPDLHLMVRDGAGWREVYSARGRLLIIMPTETGGVHDIADGGPGFSFPVWSWDGHTYQPANREVSDTEAGAGTILP